MNDRTLFEKHTEILGGSVDMYYCGKRIKTKNHVYGPEIRSHYLCVLVESGSAVLYCNGAEIRFGENDFFVMFPGERIHYRALSDWSIRWIGVTGEIVESIFEKIGITRENPIFSTPNCAALAEILEEIYCFESDGSMSAQMKARSLLYLFFSELLSCEQRRTATDYVASAKKIIKYNYNNGLTVEDVAKRLFLNAAYFSRLFKKQTGISPKKYILRFKLERAVFLLTKTDYSVKEIAASSGFKDSLYFSRIFSKNYGVSPEAYRKMHGEN